MSRPHREVLREIEGIVAVLVETGLADDQNPAFEVAVRKTGVLVHHTNMLPFGPLLRDRPYEEVYLEQRAGRAFNVLMLDGAMLQMIYHFDADVLQRHRLSFMPSPNLLDYQNHPELYEEELYYADVVDRRVVTVPLRFDYDARDGIPVDLAHPVSHLSLGQYSGCRVPVVAGVTPHAFVDFILRSFYSTAFERISVALPGPRVRFHSSITELERTVVYVGVPTSL